MKMKRIKAELKVGVVRKVIDPNNPVTEIEAQQAILALEQHINSFPLLHFNDDIVVSVRIHMKGEIKNESDSDEPDACTFDDRHPNLRCG